MFDFRDLLMEILSRKGKNQFIMLVNEICDILHKAESEGYELSNDVEGLWNEVTYWKEEPENK